MRTAEPPPGTATPSASDRVREGLRRYQAGDLEGAAAIFQALVDAEPGQVAAWNDLALALSGLGRHAEAGAALETALRIDPRQPQSWISLANARLQLGLFAGAAIAADRALAHAPQSAAAWQLRALACHGLDDFAGATEALTHALALEGESASLCANLGSTLLKTGRFADAAPMLARAAELDPASAPIAEAAALSALALAALEARPLALPDDDEAADRFGKTALLLLDAAGERAAAARVGEAWAARRPQNVEARHLRDAVTARAVERQPPELVAQRFDEMAEDFDQVLLERLSYGGPRQLAALLSALSEPRGDLDVLDLGCGTGLCGPVLRPFARRLEGVDLSHGMLAKAAERAVYDQLELGDMVEALGPGRDPWDLICVFDAFPYLGDLAGVFESAAASLAPSGWFVFSTERAGASGYELLGNGRYAHAPAYVAELAAPRFDIVTETYAPLRREAGRIVEGGYYLLRRR